MEDSRQASTSSPEEQMVQESEELFRSDSFRMQAMKVGGCRHGCRHGWAAGLRPPLALLAPSCSATALVPPAAVRRRGPIGLAST